MEDYHGDLADILRSNCGQLEAGATTELSQLNQSDAKDDYLDDFGNPFSTIFIDPLFENLDIPITSFFSSQTAPKLCCDDDDNYRYSTHHQISPKLLSSSSHIISSCSATPTNSPRLLKPLIATNHELICNDYHNHIMISGNTSTSSTSTSTNCFVENNGVQISSPRYTGIKRRKGQAKKVVCIPAPSPVNSRPTGEIVPSDLWAWRKYGQKPIKGSPYPRGYYRCSSSKGCSARKQVERSRTEPNMLVITYTSEHNHPWPTQRNALAGSTKNQPPASKNNINNNNSAKASPTTTTVSNHSQKSPNLLIMKEEQKEIISNINTNINVKDVEEKDTKLDGESLYSAAAAGALPTGSSIYHPPDQDFFAELGEIEADDPLNLMIFTQGITNKVATLDDPFGFYN